MKTQVKHTRQSRLNNECTHREYYAQFVTNNILNVVESRFTKNRILKFISEDPNLNNIPLQEWDMLGRFINSRSLNDAMKNAGDYTTRAGLVCIAKEAARQIAES